MLKRLAVTVLTIIISSSYYAQASDYTLVESTKDYIQYKDQYKELYTYFTGLEPDLFQSLVIRNSRGPKWKQQAEDLLDSEHDFHEWASYFGERVDNSCDEYFNDPEDVYEAENDWTLRWRAVADKNNPKKSKYYLVDFVTLVYGPKGVCELYDATYVFDKKLNQDKSPKYLGNFSEILPKLN